jgi:hypothetical protein
VAGDLPGKSIDKILKVVAGLDGKSKARDITKAFVAPTKASRKSKVGSRK